MALVQLGLERRQAELRDLAYAVYLGFNDPKKIPTLGRGGAPEAPEDRPPPPQDGDAPAGDGGDVQALARAGADTSFVDDYF